MSWDGYDYEIGMQEREVLESPTKKQPYVRKQTPEQYRDKLEALLEEVPQWEEVIVEEHVRYCIVEWVNGKSFSDLAREYGVTSTTIKAWILGVGTKGRKGAYKKIISYRTKLRKQSRL